MKDFVKMTLAVICGLLIVSFLSSILFFGIIGASALAGKGSKELPKQGVLKIDMSKTAIDEQGAEASPLADLPMPAISGVSISTPGEIIGIWDAVQALNKAATDPAVQYIYLKTDGMNISTALLQEFRQALSNFRAVSGKPVVAYIEAPSTGSYYLASVADKVYMTANPGATTTVNGVSTSMMFYGDLLKKLGVNVQLIRHGKYKSAGETFTRNSSSPENREQYQALVDALWKSIAAEVAESRSISVDQLNAAIDNLSLCLPQDFVDAGLVDELFTRSQLNDKLASLAGVEDVEDVKAFTLSDYISAKKSISKAKQKIAVIYLNGEIIDGRGNSDVAGDRFASIISKVRADSTVKAVVMRVNSPGGSVLASDKIKTELDLLKAEKPLVASYGAYAASGGYWISANAEKIYSDATTLTGSIGVFGMVPDFSKTLKDIAHVGVESVTSNKHGDMYSLMRPFDQAEHDYMLRSIEDIYDRFTGLVAEGRGLDKTFVDEVGQGRVWAGSDALTIHLVDEIGTLEDAVKYAANLAGDPDLAAWNIKGYPREKSQMDAILEMFNGGSQDKVGAAVKNLSDIDKLTIMARMPYDLDIK